MPDHRADRSPETLCLLRLSALGDVCNTVPVIRTLQAHWPRTRLTWVIGKLEAQLVGDIADVEFIIFDKGAGASAYRQLRAAMRGRHFDILLHMQVSLRASLASLLIPARQRLGFDRARAKAGQWLFTDRRIAPAPRQHVVDGFFGFLEALGIGERELRWDIPIPPAAHAFAEAHLPSGPILAISPCSSSRFRNFRNWAVERYAAVADYAAERHGLQVVLTGGPSAIEREYGEAITRLSRHPVTNLIGKTNVKELLAVLSRAAVVISPDSGPAHMANAVGTPVVGLYATSNPERTGPYLHRRRVVNRYPQAVMGEFHKEVSQLRWGKRVRDPSAMDLITVAAVTRALDEVVGAAALASTTAESPLVTAAGARPAPG